MNREMWLNTLLKKLDPIFTEHNLNVPTNIRVSVGFPSKGVKSKVIGECWDMEQSEDKQFEIFIHPNQDDSIKVAGILVHEVCHAVVGIAAKHGPEFKECALKVGLCGKMKATEETPELINKLTPIIKEIGNYPHSKLHPPSKGDSKQSNPSVVKLVCPKDGYMVRTSKKWIELGNPTCPCGEEMTEGDVEIKE